MDTVAKECGEMVCARRTAKVATAEPDEIEKLIATFSNMKVEPISLED